MRKDSKVGAMGKYGAGDGCTTSSSSSNSSINGSCHSLKFQESVGNFRTPDESPNRPPSPLNRLPSPLYMSNRSPTTISDPRSLSGPSSSSKLKATVSTDMMVMEMLGDRCVVEQEGDLASSFGVTPITLATTQVPMISPLQFNLNQWREYAATRHSDNQKFNSTPHGQTILQEMSKRLRQTEVENLNKMLSEQYALVDQLRAALASEQSERLELKQKLVHMERRAEQQEEERRKWMKDSAAGRARVSNLERRLAGMPGGLKGYLHGNSPGGHNEDGASPGIRSSISGSTVAGGGAGAGVSGGRLSEESSGNGARRRERERTDEAELEMGQERRRHTRELEQRDQQLEKLRLDVRRLQGERNGLQRAVETQAAFWAKRVSDVEEAMRELKKSQEAPPVDIEALAASTAAKAVVSHLKLELEQSKKAREDDRVMNTSMEDGLRAQIDSLRGLLLQAVSAAVPTISLPPAVMVAVASIRGQTYTPPPIQNTYTHTPTQNMAPVYAENKHPGSTAGWSALDESKKNKFSTDDSRKNRSSGIGGGAQKASKSPVHRKVYIQQQHNKPPPKVHLPVSSNVSPHGSKRRSKPFSEKTSPLGVNSPISSTSSLRSTSVASPVLHDHVLSDHTRVVPPCIDTSNSQTTSIETLVSDSCIDEIVLLNSDLEGKSLTSQAGPATSENILPSASRRSSSTESSSDSCSDKVAEYPTTSIAEYLPTSSSTPAVEEAADVIDTAHTANTFATEDVDIVIPATSSQTPVVPVNFDATGASPLSSLPNENVIPTTSLYRRPTPVDLMTSNTASTSGNTFNNPFVTCNPFEDANSEVYTPPAPLNFSRTTGSIPTPAQTSTPTGSSSGGFSASNLLNVTRKMFSSSLPTSKTSFTLGLSVITEKPSSPKGSSGIRVGSPRHKPAPVTESHPVQNININTQQQPITTPNTSLHSTSTSAQQTANTPITVTIDSAHVLKPDTYTDDNKNMNNILSGETSVKRASISNTLSAETNNKNNRSSFSRRKSSTGKSTTSTSSSSDDEAGDTFQIEAGGFLGINGSRHPAPIIVDGSLPDDEFEEEERSGELSLEQERPLSSMADQDDCEADKELLERLARRDFPTHRRKTVEETPNYDYSGALFHQRRRAMSSLHT